MLTDLNFKTILKDKMKILLEIRELLEISGCKYMCWQICYLGQIFVLKGLCVVSNVKYQT